ncbi:hypothetical protein [Halanaerobacter jeridensis]|uniref:Uncharacterized protein n=1 Tax=Halanaerobacter jeridensis TaxID=706427 RepID=A0A938XT52_9FIRM|nr:hypothetical protein [Halanaerobacter jeridensis]MBM7556399.1 hypothetical protein [Halanaerobacter jeridensis]
MDKSSNLGSGFINSSCDFSNCNRGYRGGDKETVRAKIKKYLYEKYGEKFVVDRIGQRKIRDREFYQARIYPKSIKGTNRWLDDYYHATASLYKDTGGIGDGYGIVKMNMNAEEYLMPKVIELFGERVKLKIGVDYRERIDDSKFFRRYLKHNFEERLKKVKEDPENKRMMLDLDVYVFDRIEDDKEKEERRQQIFEFVQYLKGEGLFKYLELGVIFIDERVLAPSYNDFEWDIRYADKVKKEIEGETVRMPPMDLR